MKKIFTMFAALLMAAVAFGQSYGILVNGHIYYEGTMVDEFEGFTQYLAHVEVSAGDYCQLYDKDNEASWAVTLNTASVDGFTLNGDRYEVTADGCYDFYIKLKFGADELYIGNGSDCGEGEDISGGGGGGDPQPGGGAKDYYLKGYCNGADIEQPTYDELFEHGKLEYSFTETGYFFVLVCDPGQKIGVEYMPATYTEGLTHITLVKQGGQKFPVNEGAGGSVMFYLYDNEDGTYELSIEELPGKKLVDSEEDEPGENALNEVQAVDSESPMYNLLGEKVDAGYKGVVIQNGKKFILR